MSYFGRALEGLLERKQMKAVRLAELSGVSQSVVSRLITGDQKSPSAEDMDRLQRALSSDPVDQAELLRAHLLDECHGPGASRIDIVVKGEPPALYEQPAPYLVKLPADIEESLNIIREHVIRDQNVREIIEGLGNLLKSGDCRTSAELHDSAATPEAGVSEAAMKKVTAIVRKQGKKTPQKK